jgi:hypothetical protein
MEELEVEQCICSGHSFENVVDKQHIDQDDQDSFHFNRAKAIPRVTAKGIMICCGPPSQSTACIWVPVSWSHQSKLCLPQRVLGSQEHKFKPPSTTPPLLTSPPPCSSVGTTSNAWYASKGSLSRIVVTSSMTSSTKSTSSSSIPS